MAQPFKEIGKNLNEAWSSVAEGWRDLLSRGSAALTRYSPGKQQQDRASGLPAFPIWGLLAGEVIERDKSIIVQVELPGLNRDDCNISVTDDGLRITGEKRVNREHAGSRYYVMERAYGTFERVIPLPAAVDADSARATLRDGVLRIELKKRNSSSRRLVTVK